MSAVLSLSVAGQLILPDALKLLPLYALAFLKSAAIRADVRPDERATFLYFLYCLPCSKILPLLYGRFVDLSTLIDQKDLSRPIPPSLPLSSENLKEGRLFLLENGNDLLLKVESNVSKGTSNTLQFMSETDQFGPAMEPVTTVPRIVMIALWQTLSCKMSKKSKLLGQEYILHQWLPSFKIC